MTNRNSTPLPSFNSDDESPELELILQNSTRILALAAADLIMHLSDSNLDESFALAEMISMLTTCIYCNDQTMTLRESFDELIADETFLDDLFFAPADLPLLAFFDRD